MTPSFNQLNPAEVERLAKLSEECSEVIKTVCKILLHGYESVDPTGVVAGTNRQQLEKEIGDVRAAIVLMTSRSDVDFGWIEEATVEKIDKYKDGKCYLHHQ